MAEIIALNSAAAVVNWFIDKNRTDGVDLTHLKIQKLLYFAQGFHLAYWPTPLFADPIEAWKYGPVVRSIYYALRSHAKHEVITDYINGSVMENGVYRVTTPVMDFSVNDGLENFMEAFWSVYSKDKTWELVAASHAEGSPWTSVYSASKDVLENPIIPVELMKTYFTAWAGREKRNA
ncbi:MAG: DUF4065 domain-containing protein [Deltaproteobacteria bacterium]|jgi:uncharacterized phage-associated protein|nr:DUF4065 domain-containing protein [Deltaproteobacteria bacterium]